MDKEILVPIGSTTTPVSGKRIALAGKLGGMNRREAANLLRSFDATVVDLSSAKIDWIIIGAEEYPLADADLLNPALQELAASGEIEIVQETELWQRLGLVDLQRNIKTFYTPAMLADLLKVSVRVIRRWHRRGLIVPVRTLHKLPYFDFQEVATARRIAELVAAGASPQAIETRLRELSAVLPDVERPLAQLSVIIEGRHVLLRQGEGLIEPGGQLRFDFAANETGSASGESDGSILKMSSSDDADHFPPDEEDELLADVYRFEDEGDLGAAIDLCRAVLARDGLRADICFQLGELLYRDGQVEAARERYYCAIEIDDTYVEARTNLACVLAETGRHDLAIASLEGVLTLQEDNPDAHYNLALSLDAIGDQGKAAKHRARFNELAPTSPWATVDSPEIIDESGAEAGLGD